MCDNGTAQDRDGRGAHRNPAETVQNLYGVRRRFKIHGPHDARIIEQGSIRISYAHGLTGRIPAAAARTARGVGCLGSTAR